jgi:hypothetical protein
VHLIPHYAALVAQKSHPAVLKQRQIFPEAFVSKGHPLILGARKTNEG